MNCPYCNRPVILAKPGAAPGNWQQITRQQLNTTAPAPWTVGAPTAAADFAGYDYEKRAPAREPNLQADVLVPAAQSLLTGLALGVPTSAGMGLLGYEFNAALLTGAGLALAATAATWLIKMDLHSRLLWAIETATGHDLDGDNQTGPPEPPAAAPIRVELAQGPRTRLIDLPVTDDKLAQLARAVLRETEPLSFSRRELTKTILTDGEYRELAAAMLAGGLLAAKGKTAAAGVELTHAGKAILKKFITEGEL